MQTKVKPTFSTFGIWSILVISTIILSALVFFYSSAVIKKSKLAIDVNNEIKINIGQRVDSLQPEFLAEEAYLQNVINGLKVLSNNPHMDNSLRAENIELLKKLSKFQHIAEHLYKKGNDPEIFNDPKVYQVFIEDLDQFLAETTGLNQYSVKHLVGLAERNMETLRLVSENSALRTAIAEQDDRYTENNLHWKNRHNVLNSKQTALQNGYKELEATLALNEEKKEELDKILMDIKSELDHQKSLYVSLKNKNKELENLVKIKEEAIKAEQQEKCDIIFDLLDVARAMNDKVEMTLGRKNRKKLDIIRVLRAILQNQSYDSYCGYGTTSLQQEFPEYYNVIKLGKRNTFD